MILASAIKFHVDKTDEDVVLCGCRHGDIFKQLQLLGFNPKDGYKIIEQGFITHNNEFLNREEAFYHAKKCGQLSAKIIYHKNSMSLISEDLW